MLRSDSAQGVGGGAGSGAGDPDVLPHVPERPDQVRAGAWEEGREHGRMRGHRWEAEDGPAGSGGCLDPLQHAQHVPVHALCPPWPSVPGPSDGTGQCESSLGPQLQGRMWRGSRAGSRRVSAVEGRCGD